jgi:hypothetical protein
LPGPLETVTDKFPVYKVSAVVDRNSGKKFKGRSNQIKIFSVPADTGIRIKTGYNGILVTVH